MNHLKPFSANPSNLRFSHPKVGGYCCIRGDDVIFVQSDKIYVLANGMPSESILEITAEYLNFEIAMITLNETGDILVAVGVKEISALFLPKFFKPEAKIVKVHSSPIFGSKFNSSAYCTISDVKWHPLSNSYSDLVVLTANGDLCLLDLSVSVDYPVVKASPNTRSRRNRFGCDLDWDEFVSFTFGKSSVYDPWSSYSVILLTRAGQLYKVCPFFPHRIRMSTAMISDLQDSILRTSLEYPDSESVGLRSLAWTRKFLKVSVPNEKSLDLYEIPWQEEFHPSFQGPLKDSSPINARSCSLQAIKGNVLSVAVAYDNGFIGIFAYLTLTFPHFASSGLLSLSDGLKCYERINLNKDCSEGLLLIGDLVNENVLYAVNRFNIFQVKVNEAFPCSSDVKSLFASKTPLKHGRTFGLSIGFDKNGEYKLVYLCQNELHKLPLLLSDHLFKHDDHSRGKGKETENVARSYMDTVLDRVLGKGYNGVPLVPVSSADSRQQDFKDDSELLKAAASKINIFREKYIKSLFEIDTEARFQVVSVKRDFEEQQKRLKQLQERLSHLQNGRKRIEERSRGLFSNLQVILGQLCVTLNSIQGMRKNICTPEELENMTELQRQSDALNNLSSRIKIIDKEIQLRNNQSVKNQSESKTPSITLLADQRSKISLQLKNQFDSIKKLKEKLSLLSI